MNEGEVKALVGSTIYGHMAGQDVGTNSGTTVTDKLGNRVRVSPHVAAYASNYQEAVVCKGSAFQAVCAIWQGVPIEVADRGSRAAHGEVQLLLSCSTTSQSSGRTAITDYTDDLPPGGRGKGHHRSKGS